MNGYTGGLFEADVFPSVGHGARRNGEYLKWREAHELVKDHQPWDPTNPGCGFAGDLHSEVCIALGLKDWSELKLFSAIGSAADLFHGTDAFFEFRGAVVTLDVTQNTAKFGGYKADVIIPPAVVEAPAERQDLALAIAAELCLRQHRAAVEEQPRHRPLIRRKRIG